MAKNPGQQSVEERLIAVLIYLNQITTAMKSKAALTSTVKHSASLKKTSNAYFSGGNCANIFSTVSLIIATDSSGPEDADTL